MDIENIYGNCCLLTTVADLLRWNENFRGPELDAMKTPMTLANGQKLDYGFGLFIGEGEIFHGGATAGWRAHLTRRVKDDVSIALLCNRGDASTGSLVEKIGGALDVGPTLSPPEPAESRPHVLGLYRDPKTNAILRIVEKD